MSRKEKVGIVLFVLFELAEKSRKLVELLGRQMTLPADQDEPTRLMKRIHDGLAFEPRLHTHYPERILAIRDGLPKYKDFDPDLGGTGETVPE